MKTMLDKCAVAGDITQAIDRRGAWSCAVTVIGGAENTAIKLQSADSAGGEFTDFKTLISADEAETDQYKGFVLDLSGAGNFIKIVGATMATCVLGDCDHDVKKVAIKAGEIPSGADLENNKTATIDVSTYTEPVEIEPTAGKDGMKKATVTLSNIPSNVTVESLSVTENGTYTASSGKAYSPITVNVPNGGSWHDISDETIPIVDNVITSRNAIVAFRMKVSNGYVKGSIMGGDGDGGPTVSACGMKVVDYWDRPANCFFDTGFYIGYAGELDWSKIAMSILNAYNTSTGGTDTFTSFEVYY